MGEVINIIVAILLFFFGTLFAIIGWLAKDKLDSIRTSIDDLRADFKELSGKIEAEHEANAIQDEKIERLEDLHPSSPLTLEKTK